LRLAQMIAAGPNLAEARPTQSDYASAASQAFAPREREDQPNVVLVEAGTGVGKTLGYVAPASLWAEKNGAPVWIATYTRNLQRQIDNELDRLHRDSAEKRRRVVIRKGRENYLCLLNFQEAVLRTGLQPENAVGLGLLAHQGQELLGGTEDGAVGQPRLPVGRRQLLSQVEQAAQRLLGVQVLPQQVAQPSFQAACAAAATTLGAEQPAAQVGGFDAAQMRPEGAVGGVEQVMALVEHVAQRPRRIVEPAHRRLDHHQRVVGDHDVGLAGAADGAFDEALPVVLARRVDAFAAPVGEPRDAAAA